MERDDEITADEQARAADPAWLARVDQLWREAEKRAAPPPPELEVYMELFEVTEWRDGCVFRTVSRGHAWFAEALVKANRPAETGLIYAAASTAAAGSQMTVRLRRPS